MTTTGAICVSGSKGDTGVGLTGVTEYYLISSSSSGVTTSTSGWTTTVQTPTDAKKYLWNYEKIAYTNGESVNTTPKIIGMYSKDGINGADGVGISSITEYYARSTSNSTAPTSWSTTPPTLTSTYKYLWNYEKVTYTNGTTKETEKRVIGVYGDKGDTGSKGDKGDKGDSPVLVYRGVYSSSKTYYGTSSRVDAVKYNGVYYVARVDAGSFSNVAPTSTSKWNTFGAQFESIATGLLLADMANIANLIFKDGKLISQDGTVNGVDSSDYSNADFVPNIIIDGTTGIITTSNGLKIDKSGVTLYNSTNDDKEVVLKITSDSIGTEVDLSKKKESSVTKSISKPSNSIYMPTTSSSITSGIAEVVDIGYLSEKSTITISNGNLKCTLPGHSNSSGSVTYSTVKLEIRLLRNGAAVKSWSNNVGGSAGTTISPSLSPSYTVTIDNETFKEGRYQISIGLYFTIKANGVSGNTANFSVTGSLVYGYAKKGFEKTLMGKDGLYSCWGENKYFLCSANGIKMRQGNYLLQITSSGIKKSTNGGSSWADL